MKKIFLLTMLLVSLLSGCDEVLAQDIFVPTTLLDLDDTPDDYTGHGGDCVVVTGAEDGIEFVACAAGGGGGSALVFRVDAVTLSVDTGTLDFDGTDFAITESPANYFDITISAERISDLTGAMVTGNTETGITVTYQDADNTIDFDVALGTSIAAAEIADGDHGDFTYASGVATIDANAIALGTDTTGNYALGDGEAGNATGLACTGCVAAAEIADADHGDFTYASGVATIDANAIALGTDTTGGYAASTTEGGGATSLEADGLDALTEIAQSIKTAANDTSALVVGTAGATNELAKWDANGNLVAHNVIIGTLTDGKWCSYASSGTVLSCTQDAPAGSGDVTAVGNCTSGDCFTGANGTTFASNSDLIMDLDENNDGSESFQIRNGANTLLYEVNEAGDQTMTGDLTIIGDDLFMTTNTSGAVLVADGTNFNPVVMSGDASINTSGVVDVIDSSTTQAGEIEVATAAETNTGTDAGRAVSPDGLAGSVFGEVVVQAPVFDWATDTATGDGKFYIYIDSKLNGMNLTRVHAQVVAVGTTSTLNVDLARCATVATGNVCSGTVADMLSTNLTVDSNEDDSSTAAAAAVIDTANDDVATGQVIRIDVDAVHTTPADGLIVTLVFQLP